MHNFASETQYVFLPIQGERAQRRSRGCNYHQSKKCLKASIWLVVAEKEVPNFERRYIFHSAQLLSWKSRQSADPYFNCNLISLEKWGELRLWEFDEKLSSFRLYWLSTDIFSRLTLQVCCFSTRVLTNYLIVVSEKEMSK